jgi:endonuclease/exonuclease/phosphatase family metal-dependent hydrolase
MRFVGYNVENLFDCVDDTLTHDNEFLPGAIRHWTPYRYWSKLHAVSRVIASIGGDRAPDFVALCEVENDSVMHDLTRRSPLRTVGYDYLMTSSADPRGIDVALMYKPTTFRPFAHRDLCLPLGRTRDVLLVSGQLYTGDTLDIFVCHLPSRLNGRKSAQLRSHVVESICQVIDSVCLARTTPRIVVMGDFNDTPQGKALLPLVERLGMNCITERLGGSYRYKGKWEQIDHVYLSPALLCQGADPTALHLSPHGAWNFETDFLVEPEPLYGGCRPLRTYNGMRYIGGTSDHLPVCFDLWFRW